MGLPLNSILCFKKVNYSLFKVIDCLVRFSLLRICLASILFFIDPILGFVLWRGFILWADFATSSARRLRASLRF
jgi:hypothetical protein